MVVSPVLDVRINATLFHQELNTVGVSLSSCQVQSSPPVIIADSHVHTSHEKPPHSCSISRGSREQQWDNCLWLLVDQRPTGIALVGTGLFDVVKVVEWECSYDFLRFKIDMGVSKVFPLVNFFIIMLHSIQSWTCLPNFIKNSCIGNELGIFFENYFHHHSPLLGLCSTAEREWSRWPQVVDLRS